MARRSQALDNFRVRSGHSDRTFAKGEGNAISGDLERKCFEFDRKIVTGVLDTLRSAIKEGALQMEMVADERMFDDSLSGDFSRTAEHLNRMSGKLKKLLGEVCSATGYPKLALDYRGPGAVVRRLPHRQT